MDDLIKAFCTVEITTTASEIGPRDLLSRRSSQSNLWGDGVQPLSPHCTQLVDDGNQSIQDEDSRAAAKTLGENSRNKTMSKEDTVYIRHLRQKYPKGFRIMEDKMGWKPGRGLGRPCRCGNLFPLPSRYYDPAARMGLGFGIE